MSNEVIIIIEKCKKGCGSIRKCIKYENGMTEIELLTPVGIKCRHKWSKQKGELLNFIRGEKIK